MGMVVMAAVVFIAAAMAGASESKPFAPPGPSQKCPVCGMHVHRYPDFLAAATYADGHTVYFDGTKDMFKFIFRHSRYAPDRQKSQIRRIQVTEYYDMTVIDADKAFYVMGSDVLGPMGRELIPFRSEADARAFKADHKGHRVLAYPQVTEAIIKRLD